MRIIAGQYRSRVIKSLEGNNTRPTQDKVKEAIFSRIGPYFESGCILDLFAGSGAVALEALSRGYDKAVMCDNSKAAAAVIASNIETLKVNQYCQLWNCNYKTALSRAESEGYQFDLIFLDPPYRYMLINELCQEILERNLLKENGLIVAESSKEEKIEMPAGLKIEKQAGYGICNVTYIRKENVL